jgi:hypothetical protein
MVYALLAAGAILGFIFTSGFISAAPTFGMRKPLTSGLQWVGLVLASSAVAASGITSLILLSAGAVLAYLVWRSKAALLVGASAGALIASLDGAGMGLLGAAFHRYSNRDALVVAVLMMAVGIGFAPNRGMITPIARYRSALRSAVARMHDGGVQLNLRAIRSRIVSARTTTAAVKATTPKKAPKAKTPKAKAAKPKPVGTPAEADAAIIDRIKAFESTTEAASVADEVVLDTDEDETEETLPVSPKRDEISEDELAELIADLEMRLRED